MSRRLRRARRCILDAQISLFSGWTQKLSRLKAGAFRQLLEHASLEGAHADKAQEQPQGRQGQKLPAAPPAPADP